MFNYRKTKINIIQGDISEIDVDGIIIAANNTFLWGEGANQDIYKKGGNIILEQCKKTGGCPTGEARITTAGNLPSKYIIHSVRPMYKGRKQDDVILYNSYFNSLKLAGEYKLKTIAFSTITLKEYDYPKEEEIHIAIEAIVNYIDTNGGFDEIQFIIPDNIIHEKYSELLKNKLSK